MLYTETTYEVLHWHLKCGYKFKLWDYFWSTISWKMTEFLTRRFVEHHDHSHSEHINDFSFILLFKIIRN